MYDISTPTDSYQKEISKLKVQIKAVDNNSELNSGIYFNIYRGPTLDCVI